MSETRNLCFNFKYLCFVLLFEIKNVAINTKIRKEVDMTLTGCICSKWNFLILFINYYKYLYHITVNPHDIK